MKTKTKPEKTAEIVGDEEPEEFIHQKALTDLAEQVTGLAGDLREEFAEGEKRNAEEIEKIAKRMNARIEKMNAFLEIKHGAGMVPGLDDEDGVKRVSMGKIRRAMFMEAGGEKGVWEKLGAEYERECLDESAKSWEKAMGTIPDSGGGELVPLAVMPSEMIENLRAPQTIEELGVRTLAGLSSDQVRIRKVTGNTTVYWVGENPTSSVTASDMVLGHIALTPHRAAVRTTMSEDLIDFSEPSVEALVNGDQMESLGLEIDRVAYKGTGTSNEPRGLDAILAAAGVAAVNWTTASAADYAQFTFLVAMETALKRANAHRRPGARLGWSMHPDVFETIRLIKSENASAGTDSGEVSRQIIAAPAPTTVIGYPFVETTQLTGGTTDADIYFGNWADLLKGEWGVVQMKVTDAVGEAAARFQKDLITSVRVDFNTRHPESFKRGDNVATLNS